MGAVKPNVYNNTLLLQQQMMQVTFPPAPCHLSCTHQVFASRVPRRLHNSSKWAGKWAACVRPSPSLACWGSSRTRTHASPTTHMHFYVSPTTHMQPHVSPTAHITHPRPASKCLEPTPSACRLSCPCQPSPPTRLHIQIDCLLHSPAIAAAAPRPCTRVMRLSRDG